LFTWVRNFSLCVTLFILLLSVILTIKNPPVIDGYIETLLVDYRFKVRNLFSPPSIPPDIIIVAIDEKSLSSYGRWPWHREVQALLIEKVFDGNPRVVAVDIFYPQSETPESDRSLARVMKRHRDKLVVALGFEAEEGKVFRGEVEDVLYESAFRRIENPKYLSPIEAYRVLLPPEPIASSSTFGHVYSLADRDGKLRWENLYIKYGDEYFPSFSLQAVRMGLGLSPDRVSIAGGRGVDLGGLLIPVDDFGRLHINYIGRENSIHFISASDVLSRRTNPGVFKNKIVFIGTSAIATYDLKVTPFSANMTGVEKNATVAANIMRQNFMKKAPLSLDVAGVLIVGIGAIIIGQRFRALQSIIALFLLTMITLISTQVLFTFHGLRVSLIYPLFAVMTEGIVIVSCKYLIEEKRAREIRRMFSSYVSPKIVKELIENPEMASPGGIRKTVTVLFSDIKDFTTLAENRRPEEAVSILNRYFQVMTDVVFKWDGTLDKFIGDKIMAFWGAPAEQLNHAELALKCAIEMRRGLRRLQEKRRTEHGDFFDAGIGINTGEVVVGNIGVKDKKMDYTIIGDHVNLGARLEKLTRDYHAEMVISEFTLTNLSADFLAEILKEVDIEEIGTVAVKGKRISVKIYRVTVKQE